jgi:hypothetical protein
MSRRVGLVLACALTLAIALALLEGGQRPSFPSRSVAPASAAFGAAWNDGNGELAGYKAVVPRYGALRVAELVLVTVTEPMNRRTWIKDDAARGADRVSVLKVNASLKFQTGIYPYSVLTSTFAPVDDWGVERFSPVKVTLTAQEWCGHVFHGIWPGRDRFLSQEISYFASEGEESRSIATPPGTLYEDALLIQLRELDGPFAGGKSWSGSIVPALWRVRKAHEPIRVVPATITRKEGETIEFALSCASYTRTFEVERGGAHHILGWTASDGEDVKLLKAARLPYWKLHDPGDESYREKIGLSAR